LCAKPSGRKVAAFAHPGDNGPGKSDKRFVTAITEQLLPILYPGSFRLPRALTLASLAPMDGTGRKSMSLGAIAVTGLVAAIVVIVVTVTLINKFAKGN
jgi:hypothetical protein